MSKIDATDYESYLLGFKQGVKIHENLIDRLKYPVKVSDDDFATTSKGQKLTDRLLKRCENPLLTMAHGKQGAGITCYTHIEMSRPQVIALLQGYISMLENNAVSIVHLK